MGLPAAIVTSSLSAVISGVTSGSTSGSICGFTASTTTSAICATAAASAQGTSPISCQSASVLPSERLKPQSVSSAKAPLAAIPRRMAEAMFPSPMNPCRSFQMSPKPMIPLRTPTAAPTSTSRSKCTADRTRSALSTAPSPSSVQPSHGSR